VKQIALAFLLMLACAPAAHAHTRSQSQSRWSIDGDAIHVRVEADAVEATRLYALGGEESTPLTDMMAHEVSESFSVAAAGRGCEAQGAPRTAVTPGGRIVTAWRFACAPGALARGPVVIESRLFLRVAPSHLHFLALRDAEGRTAEAVLTEGRPLAELNLAAPVQAQSIWQTIARFIPVGAMHVWTGLDHVAFILALVLLTGGDIRRVIFAATGFTLGHTATLGFAAIGVLRPDASVIEALIGFTIAFVALDAGGGGEARLRAWSPVIAALLAAGGAAALLGIAPMSPLIWFGLAVFVYAYPRGFPRGATWLAAVFGLIHGCGFAGALGQLDLPRPRLISSLAGFNLGVELGQVAVIAAALMIGVTARHLPETARRDAAALAGAALCALGTYWFVGRLAG
jgi:hypothetical protein